MNKAYPQLGIITTISGNKAKVMIPLFKFETQLCPVAKDLNVYVGSEVVIVFANGDLNLPVVTAVI